MCEFCGNPDEFGQHDHSFGLFDPVVAVKRAEESARRAEEERKLKKKLASGLDDEDGT
jgi:hypothetical protein